MRVLDLLLEMRKNVRYFHSSKYVGDLANGDICMAVGFSGDIMRAGNRAAEANNGIRINYVIPKEGTPIWFDMVTMPADSNNEQAAYAFMNYLLQPQVIAQITNHVQYANGLAAAALRQQSQKSAMDRAHETMLAPSESDDDGATGSASTAPIATPRAPAAAAAVAAASTPALESIPEPHALAGPASARLPIAFRSDEVENGKSDPRRDLR